MIEQEQQEIQPKDSAIWRFVLIHIDRPDYRPIIEGWPIPRVGDYVELCQPSPFWYEGSNEPTYIEFFGYVTAVKHVFHTQELPNGTHEARYETRVLLGHRKDEGLEPIRTLAGIRING